MRLFTLIFCLLILSSTLFADSDMVIQSAEKLYQEYLMNYGAQDSRTVNALKDLELLKASREKYEEGEQIDVWTEDNVDKLSDKKKDMMSSAVRDLEFALKKRSFGEKSRAFFRNVFMRSTDEDFLYKAQKALDSGDSEKAMQYLAKIKEKNNAYYQLMAAVCIQSGYESAAQNALNKLGVGSEVQKMSERIENLLKQRKSVDVFVKNKDYLGALEKINEIRKENKGDFALEAYADEIRRLKDAQFVEKNPEYMKQFTGIADEYVKNKVTFKLGGFDTVDTFKEKFKNNPDLQKVLGSDELYGKYIDKSTWKFKSKEMEKEFNERGGIDCAGFCQRVLQHVSEKAGVDYKIPRVPGKTLVNNYLNKLEDDGHIPPYTAQPGDVMRLSDKNGWGHAFVYAGRDDQGRVLIYQAAGQHVHKCVMPDRFIHRVEGCFRYKEMDKVMENYNN